MIATIERLCRVGNIRLHISTVCVILLVGCAAIKPPPEVIPPPDINTILAELKMRYDLVDSMRTWMNVRIKTQGQEEEIREYFYYQKPDKLNFQHLLAMPFKRPIR